MPTFEALGQTSACVPDVRPDPAVAPFGARFLARGDAAVAREHGLRQRTVVVEYPNLEKATAAYDSAAYGKP